MTVHKALSGSKHMFQGDGTPTALWGQDYCETQQPSTMDIIILRFVEVVTHFPWGLHSVEMNLNEYQWTFKEGGGTPTALWGQEHRKLQLLAPLLRQIYIFQA